MPTFLFYILAIIPFVIGGILYALRKEVHWAEWVINSCVCFAMAGIFHFLAISGQTTDHETWSGQIISTKHEASWRESYDEAIYRTEYYTERERYTDYVGSGKDRRSVTRYRTVTKSRRVFSHWESRTRWHPDRYSMASHIYTSYTIDAGIFNDVVRKFKSKTPIEGRRKTGEHNSRFLEGDRNDYLSENKSGWIEPVTKWVSFENKIKAAPSVFSFMQIPKDAKVYDYPANRNPFVSDRLVGTAEKVISPLFFDQLNSRLGPKKKVNLVVVGYQSAPSIYAEYQRAKYVGGKKNDIIAVFSGNPLKPDWVRVFGWTDSKTVLTSIEDIIINEGVTEASLLKVEQEIVARYKLKDWEKSFAHISVPAPVWAIWWFLGVMIVTQAGLWTFYLKNEHRKLA